VPVASVVVAVASIFRVIVVVDVDDGVVDVIVDVVVDLDVDVKQWPFPS
jgi:hypothetical protein